MTDEQLAAIRARCEAATPGPWLVRDMIRGKTYNIIRGIITREDFGRYKAGTRTIINVQGIAQPNGDGPANVEFIAAAREDVPALLAEVERLRGLLLFAGLAS